MTIKQTVFISDTHGFRGAWESLFVSMGLMDEEGNWLREDEVHLIHNGDNVDRGEDSRGLFEKVRQRKNTTRTFGNHDFAYVGGPEFGGMEAEVWAFADEILKDGMEGKMVFAHRFVENSGTEWLVTHAGLVPAWGQYHNMPMQQAVDEINRIGLAFLMGVGKWDNVLGAVGWSRGGGPSIIPGVTWADYHIDLIPMEKKLKHRQIVGHTIQPNGINLSKGGKVWGINVHYDHAQALIYDHETSEWSTSEHITPKNTPYVQPGWTWNDEDDDQIDVAGYEEFMKAEDDALNARLQNMFDGGKFLESDAS